MQRSIPEPAGWWRWAALALWACGSLLWIRADRVLRDGDEEGHVGAAELFLSDFNQGSLLGFFERLMLGPMGEYPQLFTAIAGAWWWAMGGGDPAQVAVRAVCLVSLPVTALAAGRIAARLGPRSESTGVEFWTVVMVLSLPLSNGLTRHFMPESAVATATVLAVLCALRWAERPSVSRSIQLGIVLGLGVLSKQTFVLGAAAPVAWAMLPRLRSDRARLALVVLSAVAVAGPWWAANGDQQVGYASASVAGHGGFDAWAHAWFYPRSLALLGLGPVLTIGLLFAAWRGRGNKAWALCAVWFGVGALILLGIPKKYPRLLLPLLPAVPILICAAWRPSRGAVRSIALLAAAWTTWASVSALPLHVRSPGVDPGCPQQWIRPAIQSDLGLTAAADWLDGAGSGDVLVLGDPAVPCAVQTTHDWSRHLGPLLRRRGTERAVHTDPDRAHRFVLEWIETGAATPVEALGIGFDIRDTLQP